MSLLFGGRVRHRVFGESRVDSHRKRGHEARPHVHVSKDREAGSHLHVSGALSGVDLYLGLHK